MSIPEEYVEELIEKGKCVGVDIYSLSYIPESLSGSSYSGMETSSDNSKDEGKAIKESSKCHAVDSVWRVCQGMRYWYRRSSTSLSN